MAVKRGGKREGAGRKKGSQSRATREQKATLSDLAKAHTEIALKALVSVATKSESDSARVAAANAILDRGYGKPTQAHQHSGAIGSYDLTRISDGDLSYADKLSHSTYQVIGLDVNAKNLGLGSEMSVTVKAPVKGSSPTMTFDGPITADMQLKPTLVGNSVKSVSGNVNLDAILERAVFEARGDREVADLRGMARYRVTQTGDHLWLSEVVELHDCVAGYLARGAPARGELVFDAGAYVGEFSIVAARRVGPEGRVIAFEPDARNRATLERNLAEARLDNVTICPAGLWRETGQVAFDGRGNFRSRIAAVDSAAAPSTSIPVLGWQDAVRQFGAPAFTKMDIEGAEIEVLEGAAESLRAHRGRFAIASYHPRDGAITARRLEPMLRAAGFEAETGHPSHVTTWAWKT